MLFLDKTRLENVLRDRGINIQILASACGISRQSIYNMLNSNTIFNTSFQKIIKYLQIDYKKITTEKSLTIDIIKNIPERVRFALTRLTEFCQDYEGDLILYNSSGESKFGQKTDWHLGIFFQGREYDDKLRAIRQELLDYVVPFNLSLININRAPFWLLDIIRQNRVHLYGDCPDEIIFHREASYE